MDLSFISGSGSSRDSLGGSRLWGKKEIYFPGRSFFWDLGFKLLCEHWSCAVITVIKLGSYYLLLLLSFTSYAEKVQRGWRSEGIRFLSLDRAGANLKACFCFPQLGLTLPGTFSNLAFYCEPCTCIFTEETERSLANLKW